MKNFFAIIFVGYNCIAVAQPFGTNVTKNTTDKLPLIDLSTQTNLVALGRFGNSNLMISSNIIRTNGISVNIRIVNHSVSLIEHEPPTLPPVCFIDIQNDTTNYYGCLRLPVEKMCLIFLLDKNGNKVRKTPVGLKFGLPLSENQVRDWFDNWSNSHRSRFINLFANGIPENDIPTEIGFFSITDAFEIKEAGEYELHVQVQLVQVGRDNLRNLHFFQFPLAETVSKCQISLNELNSPRQP